MTVKFYRVKDIVGTKENPGPVPVSIPTIWRWVRNGTFPKPFKLGESTTVWNVDHVHEFVRQRNASAQNTQYE